MKIAVELARDLAWADPPYGFEGFTVVENRDYDERRWNMIMELVVRDDKGDLFRAFYERGLTENQETTPFYGEGDEIEFDPVEQTVIETYAYNPRT